MAEPKQTEIPQEMRELGAMRFTQQNLEAQSPRLLTDNQGLGYFFTLD
jgi:hypothetical protein